MPQSRMAELYADLDDKVLEIEADELRARNQELEEKITRLNQEHLGKIDALEKKVEALLKEKATLETNISSLFETAVNELARKDTMYNDLQKEYNSLQRRFRESKR